MRRSKEDEMVKSKRNNKMRSVLWKSPSSHVFGNKMKMIGHETRMNWYEMKKNEMGCDNHKNRWN